MSVLEIRLHNTFVHYPSPFQCALKRQKRGASCDAKLRVAYPEIRQATKFSGSRLPYVFGLAAQEETSQFAARLRGSARLRSARQRSGRRGCQKPLACQTEDVSDAETAVPSPDASPCPSSVGSPLQTPSPSPMLRVPMSLLELPRPGCVGLPHEAWTGGGCVVPPCAQHVAGSFIVDREGSYAAPFDPSSCDLVVQTPSPVLPTWRPAWAHASSLGNVATVEATPDSDDDACSTFSDDSDDFFGCSCQCGSGRRAHVPFVSFLGPDEIDEDFCPACCNQKCSCSFVLSTCSSPELEQRTSRAVYDSPGEAFWR